LDFSLITQLLELNQTENNANYNGGRLNQLEGKTYGHFASRFFAATLPLFVATTH
jgi:hypothetical protein